MSTQTDTLIHAFLAVVRADHLGQPVLVFDPL